MSNFNFEITLYMNDFNQITIQPPHSLLSLKEIAFEKFNITKADFYYQDLDSDKVNLHSDDDYFSLFNYIDDNNIKEAVIFICDDDKQKKKTANRKNSRAMKPKMIIDSEFKSGGNGNIGGGNNSDDDVAMSGYDADDFKDIRNLKYNDELEEGIKYTKHGYNAKNQMRIYYIKEKKEIMKKEAENKYKEKLDKEKLLSQSSEPEVDLMFGVKNKKNKMKKQN